MGVARQYCGVLGKQDNCQVAVSVSVANEAVSLPAAYQLYLPESWAGARRRRRTAGVPAGITFQPKWQIALGQIQTAQAEGVPRAPVVADAGYGDTTAFRETLTTAGLAYVVGVKKETTAWPPGEAPHGEAFDLCVVALLLSHYFAFTGHMAILALGPRFALAPAYRTELTGLLVAEPIWHFLDALEGIKRDAFPSGHVSAALISVHYIFRFTPRLACCALPAVYLMICATLCLRYHCAADILGGGMLAALCVLLAPRLLRHEHPTSRG